MRALLVIAALGVPVACDAETVSPHRWKQFTSVDGQPELVPVEWIGTAEGKLAHSFKLPKPLPKESGYRKGMSSEEYFLHLCNEEAGSFVYRTVEAVDGFYLMRPPKRPSDEALKSRYRLEAPDIERLFQLYPATTADRSTIFVIPGLRFYRYVEERDPNTGRYLQAFGLEPGTTRPRKPTESAERKSDYGLTWRGIKRPLDREHLIAGGEWIVVDLKNSEVLAIFRNYARTGGVRNVQEGIWWLNAVQCPHTPRVASAGHLGQQLYKSVERVLKPAKGDAR